jgi:hypothetical protein
MDPIVPSTNPSPTGEIDPQVTKPKMDRICALLTVMSDFFYMATERALKDRREESSNTKEIP